MRPLRPFERGPTMLPVKFPRLAFALLLVVAATRPCAADSGACAHKSQAKSASAAKHSGCTDPSSASAARGPAAGAQRCSLPYSGPCDVGANSSAAASSRATVADDPPPAAAPAHAAPAPPRKLKSEPRTVAESPAFGPLFLAHQALML